jgi:hypothetical protein
VLRVQCFRPRDFLRRERIQFGQQYEFLETFTGESIRDTSQIFDISLEFI